MPVRPGSVTNKGGGGLPPSSPPRVLPGMVVVRVSVVLQGHYAPAAGHICTPALHPWQAAPPCTCTSTQAASASMGCGSSHVSPSDPLLAAVSTQYHHHLSNHKNPFFMSFSFRKKKDRNVKTLDCFFTPQTLIVINQPPTQTSESAMLCDMCR